MICKLGHGVEQNDTKAVNWFRRAAAKGSVHGQVNLGRMYLNGRGVVPSDTEALKWYRKAANQGHPRALKILADMGY